MPDDAKEDTTSTFHPPIRTTLKTPYKTTYKQGLEDEIGSTGLLRQGGQVDEEFHRVLQGIQGVRTFREMSDNDSTVGASLYVMKSLIRQTKWKSVAADDSPEAKELADWLDGIMVDMSFTWSDLLTEILTMVVYGWAWFEKVWKKRDGSGSRFVDGRIGIKKLGIRAQKTMDDWEWDENGGIRGMWQAAAPDFKRVLIPIERSVLFRTETTLNNPEGYSLLRPAYRSWYFLKRLQEVEAIGMERDLAGLPVIELPDAYTDPNATQDKKDALAAFIKLGQNIRRNHNELVIFPSEEDANGKTGFKLRLLTTGGSRQINISGAIERYEKRISATMLTQFLFLGMDKVGSFSLSSDMTDIFAVALGAILDNIEETLDRFVIRDLMQMNGFPEELWPRWAHGDIEKPDLAKVAASIVPLVDSGALTLDVSVENMIRELAGLPPLEVEEEEVDVDVLAGVPNVEELEKLVESIIEKNLKKAA